MNRTIRLIGCAALSSAVLLGGPRVALAQPGEDVSAQEAIETSNLAGTVSEFNPDSIVIRTERSEEPLRYTTTKTTTYVDESGAPVSVETVKSGLPVTVYYTRDGARIVASKVVVRRSVTAPPSQVIDEKNTTTTTTDK